jgi:hypothetical protein
MVTPMDLIYEALLPSISTFEIPSAGGKGGFEIFIHLDLRTTLFSGGI